ncbi:MAG: hypothetical protein IPH20_26545 [Bacteroidales bacterium]|nr:hypothetical protein [Bacteroidales bacterium]
MKGIGFVEILTIYTSGSYSSIKLNMNKMKKPFIQIAAFLLLFNADGFCQLNDYAKSNLKGKVKTVTEKTYQTVKAGETFIKGRMVQWYLNAFNEQGNKTEDIKYMSDSAVDKKYIYSYNTDGSRKEMAVYNADDLLRFKIVYHYDDKGQLTEDISYDEKNRPGKKIAYLYGSNGKVMEENIYNAEGELRQKIRYSYNSSNLISESNRYKENGELERRNAFKYDGKGNETEDQVFYADGKLVSSTTYLYQLDKQDNWIKKTAFVDNQAVSIVERTIAYY